MWYGLPFGAAVWANGYVVLPLLGVYKPIWKYDLETLCEGPERAPRLRHRHRGRLLDPDQPGGRPMTSTESATRDRSTATADLKLEVVVIPVADADRSKDFYKKPGWRLDADFAFDNGFRVVQFTPPGSGASIQFGSKITSAPPGSGLGLYLIVSDIQVAHDEFAGLGVGISDVFHAGAPGAQFQRTAPIASAGSRQSTRPMARSRRSATPTATSG